MVAVSLANKNIGGGHSCVLYGIVCLLTGSTVKTFCFGIGLWQVPAGCHTHSVGVCGCTNTTRCTPGKSLSYTSRIFWHCVSLSVNGGISSKAGTMSGVSFGYARGEWFVLIGISISCTTYCLLRPRNLLQARE